MLVLADASIWIDHLRAPVEALSRLLASDLVIVHSMVVGEIALGSLTRRTAVLNGLIDLPPSVEAEHHEVMSFIENHRLFSVGIGYVDVHLIASCLLTPNASLWTRDGKLHRAADRLGLAYVLPD